MTASPQSKGNTIRLTRVLKAPRERVFKAFWIPMRPSKWMAPLHLLVHVVDPSNHRHGVMRFTHVSLPSK